MRVQQRTGSASYHSYCLVCGEEAGGPDTRAAHTTWSKRHCGDRGHEVYMSAERITQFTLAGGGA